MKSQASSSEHSLIKRLERIERLLRLLEIKLVVNSNEDKEVILYDNSLISR